MAITANQTNKQGPLTKVATVTHEEVPEVATHNTLIVVELKQVLDGEFRRLSSGNNNSAVVPKTQ
jgi:capsule polysaccharide export protein KpsE/RkpR